jgi:glucose/arabinose dehydrogenase
MKRRALVFGLGSLVVGLMAAPTACDPESSPQTPPGGPSVPQSEVFTAQDGTRFVVETLLTNLEIPWSLAFAPDGRLFFTERPGRVRVMRNGILLPEPALVLTDVVAEGEAGLLGLTLHPDFARNGLVYLLYTARAPGGAVNRVVRYREVDNRLAEPAVVVEGMRAASIHDGGRIRFGPDGRLYITMGDAANPPLAQSLGELNGKILRVSDDGTTPRDNPFASPIFSYGHRNPQGLDWHPATGDLWATEHGEAGNDELNLVRPGRNYGWRVIEGAQTRPDMETPVLFYTPAVAPSGASFYTGSAIPAFRNNLFIATLRGQHIRRIRFDPNDPRRVASDERLLESRFGRVRDIVTGPDGALYFCTSNRDNRNTPTPQDDRIARIVPAPAR